MGSMKIDDLIINSYVDGELSEQELKEFDAIMNVDVEIRQKVQDLIKFNQDAKEAYDEIITDDIPSSMKELLIEKESIWKRVSNLKIGIFPTIGSILAASLGSVLTFNSIQMASVDEKRPELMLEEPSKNLIVQEIEKITGESEDFIVLSGIFEKRIVYSIKSEFINNSKENCVNIEFENLNYQDLTITEAVICDQDGLERIVKLSFIKGPIQDI
jgi:hypothetical protein